MISEKGQAIHRTINTVLSIVIVFIFLSMINPIIDKISGLEEKKVIQSEISQIASDESFRRCIYNDSLGKKTVGFGHLIVGGEDIVNGCITPKSAIKMLRKDYTTARNGVIKNYPWADGEIKLILTNMTFQLGNTGVSKFENTIKHLKANEYDHAAAEMIDSLWCEQTTNRCARLVGRTMALQGE